jgi:DUF4097 and DUF4098 domain-containing protein YvlB
MKITTSTTVALSLLVAWTASPVSKAGDDHSISKVNGSIRAAAGNTYDTVSTVNGDVRLEQGAIVDAAKTVNGSIVLDGDVKIGTLTTVNGSLEIGEGSAVSREATTVNGDVSLARRASVGGNVSTVSGGIELHGAQVTGKLTTVNGDIDLTDGARVLGGIHIKKSNSVNWGWGQNSPPEVHICSTCVVEGELRFDRPVRLRVDQGAKIGNVIGDEVERR